MFLRSAKKEVKIERFKAFRTQTNYGCKGQLKTKFFDMSLAIDEEFVEYFKPFGYPVLQAGIMYEIKRDNFFRLLLPLGRTNFHARFVKNCDPHAGELLMRQVQRALDKDVSPAFISSCPEEAISLEPGKPDKLSARGRCASGVKIDMKKCTFCLECI